MHVEQKTFIAVKPDGVRRGLVGEIINRFEKKGYNILDAADGEADRLHFCMGAGCDRR